MSLSEGTTLGSYRIVSPLGVGGMGEVYRATDANLGRQVAIKVLPDAFAQDPERLARFEREAKTLAALNHPNIAQIYGLEKSGPSTGSGQAVTLALVMELVEGPTLQERLEASGLGKRTLPLDEALAIARQIAEALEAAHEQGIIHRDLKPANIKVREDGTIKVLDFGLAKLVEASGEAGRAGGAGMSQSPTITTPAMTQMGMILGTAAYMSPEQARGKPVDRRADIWAFGCVLYEMLSGKRAFEDEDVSLTLSKVLQREPDFEALPKGIPAHVRNVLALCLRKDLRQRIGDMHDVRLALDGSFETASPVSEAKEKAFQSAWRLVLASSIATAVVAGTASWLLKPSPPAPQQVVRFEMRPPAGGVFPGANNTPRMAVSPDGRYVAFTLNLRDGKPDQLWLRRLDSLEATPLTTITDATGEPVQQPFWSPDSRFVGFFVAGQLKKMDVAGGVVQTLCNVPGNNYGGTWNGNGTILFASTRTNGIQRVSASGGVPSQLTTLVASSQETAHFWPRFLPDGRHFLYQSQGASPDDRTIYVGSIDSPDRTLVFKSPYMVDFSPPGHLLFLRDGALLAQPFDAEALKLRGEPVAVAEGVRASFNNGRTGFTVSGTGVLVYRPDNASVVADSQLVWVDRTGRELGVAGSPSRYRGVELSPDDRRVAVHLEEGEGVGDLWVRDLERGSTSRLTFDAAQHSMAPVWSPDGQRILFSKRLERGFFAIFDKASNGVGDERRLYESKASEAIPWSVSPDGTTLVLTERNIETARSLKTMPLTGGSAASLYIRAPAEQWFGQVSPDGRWMAYVSSESGRSQVYVQSFPKPESRYQVSTTGGTQPRWRRDGRELFYRTGPFGQATSAVLAVTVESAEAGLRFGLPKTLFEAVATNFGHVVPTYDWAVSSDGQRFLVLRAPGGSGVNPFEAPVAVVINWDAALAPR